MKRSRSQTRSRERVKRVRRSKKRRVIRYSKSKRVDLQRVPSEIGLKSSRLTNYINRNIKSIPARLNPFFLRDPTGLLCKKRQKRADNARRRQFFRAKSRGDASSRPIHIRKFIRC